MNGDISEVPPGGSWVDRNPSFGRTCRALLRKSFLIKVRHIPTIIEELLAVVLVGILWILCAVGKQDYDDMPSPPVLPASTISELVDTFEKSCDAPNYVAAPNYNSLKYILGLFFNSTVPDVPIYSKFKYYNNYEEIKDALYASDMYGTGFYWENLPDTLNQSDPEYLAAVMHPQFSISEQSTLYSFSSPMTFMVAVTTYTALSQTVDKIPTLLESGLKSPETIQAVVAQSQNLAGLSSTNFEQITDEEAQKMLTTIVEDSQAGIQNSINIDYVNIQGPNISTQTYPVPKFTAELPLGIAVQFFCSMQIVIASMPDSQQVLEDRDTHVDTLMFLMGCSETAYWLITFIVSFIMCFIPYFVIMVLFCFVFALKGTDFSVMLVLTIMFIIAHLMFQFFILTFIRRGSSGRVLTIIFLVLSIFFGYLNDVYTLQPDSNQAVKHVFSLFPICCYELCCATMYTECRNNREPINWGLVGNNDYEYPIWYGFMWFGIDIVLYFSLFLLFNATNDRGFGNPIIGWREIFQKQAWQRVCRGSSHDDDNYDQNAPIIKIENLKKQYKGTRTIMAVDDVSFEIKRGEIIVMIGPNGAGKSSIINTLSGAINNSGGTLSINGGRPETSFREIQHNLGIVFQENVIVRLLSIREHLEIFGAFRGIPDDDLEDAIQFFAHTLQLTEMLPNRAGDLSGGQKRKLCISLSLLGNPPIVIMDEPTAGVDVQARQLIWKTISNLTASTSIITTHALEEAEAVSSRLFVVSRGKMPFQGTSTQFREQFRCGYLLKIDSDSGDCSKVLELAQKYEPHSQMIPERDDTITISTDADIPKFLKDLEAHKEEMGVNDYTFSVEQLEDVLLRILETS